MEKFRYIEDLLIRTGRDSHCQEMPTREAGQSPDSWFDDVREVANAGVKCRKWTQDFADDMVFCAELLCAELRRYPAMIAWDHQFYVMAVEATVHPDNEHGMSLLTDPGFFDDDRPLDAETSAFLDSLISEEEGARA